MDETWTNLNVLPFSYNCKRMHKINSAAAFVYLHCFIVVNPGENALEGVSSNREEKPQNREEGEAEVVINTEHYGSSIVNT